MNALCRLSIVPIVLVSMAQARGATISSSQDAGFFGDFTCCDSGSATMPVFDVGLGTLQSVSINYVATIAFSEDMVNTQPAGATSTYAISGEVEFGALGNFTADPATWTLTGPTGGLNAGYAGTLTLNGSTAGDPSVFADPSNPVATDILVNAFIDQNSCVGFCQGVQSVGDSVGTVDGTLTTTFTYAPGDPPGDPVPEPSGLALLGVGLIAVGATRMRGR